MKLLNKEIRPSDWHLSRAFVGNEVWYLMWWDNLWVKTWNANSAEALRKTKSQLDTPI